MIFEVADAIQDAYRKHGDISELIVVCRDDGETVFSLSDHDYLRPPHWRENARSIGLRAMVSVQSHRKETGHLNYDVGIEPREIVKEIDVTITVNG